MLTIHPSARSDGTSPIQIPRLTLNTIIRPRVDEILELIRDRLVASGFSGRIGRRVVMTGGGSQLTGMTDVARQVFGRPVRMGRPLGVKGLPIAARGAAFSAVIGLLIYPQLAPAALFEALGPRRPAPSRGSAAGCARASDAPGHGRANKNTCPNGRATRAAASAGSPREIDPASAGISSARCGHGTNYGRHECRPLI